MKAKDYEIIRHIGCYCIDIQNTMNRFGKAQAAFENDVDYRNSICMSLLQIGELTGHLSEEFREETKQFVYWPAIKGMRNVFAHDYGAIDYERVWETVEEDIPVLLEFCQNTAASDRPKNQKKELPDE